MKKFLAILLTVALCLGMLPTFAEGGMDEELTRITLLVKEQLGIGDEYGSFSGEYYNNGRGSTWYLHWSNPDTLNVECNDNGVISYYSYYTDGSYFYDSVPAFPKYAQEEALDEARAFLKRVCVAGEDVQFTSIQATDALRGNYWYLSGKFLWNGLPTEATFDINLNANDLTVAYYCRSGMEYLPQSVAELPFVSKISIQEAEEKLKDTLCVELQYVSDGDAAVLRYIPEGASAWLVDAQTGELVSYAHSDEYMYTRNEGMEMMGAKGADSGLSAAEQIGVDRMKDVLGQDVLEARLREQKWFGLSEDYVMDSINYYAQEETILARMSFQWDGKQNYVWKSFLLDAKTGAIQYVYTSRYARYANGQTDIEQGQVVAEEFLREYFPEEFAQTMLTESYSDNTQTSNFCYTRLHDGIPMPEHALNVRVYGDGTIDGFSMNWKDDVQFQDSARRISAETALQSYRDALQAELRYAFLADNYADVFDSESEDISIKGKRVLLSYCLTGDEKLYAIDGMTGEALYNDFSDSGIIAYADTDDCREAEKWLKLAQYGVGYADGRTEAQSEVTLREFCGLLLSAYDIRISDGTDEDIIRQMGYYDIVLESLDGNVTRLEAAKMVARLSGYCKAAELRSIYRCNFADAESIPEAEYGYIAIAQGLGIAQADSDGNFRPTDAATREDAIEMLYALLDRNNIL